MPTPRAVQSQPRPRSTARGLGSPTPTLAPAYWHYKCETCESKVLTASLISVSGTGSYSFSPIAALGLPIGWEIRMGKVHFHHSWSGVAEATLAPDRVPGIPWQLLDV